MAIGTPGKFINVILKFTYADATTNVNYGLSKNENACYHRKLLPVAKLWPRHCI